MAQVLIGALIVAVALGIINFVWYLMNQCGVTRFETNANVIGRDHKHRHSDSGDNHEWWTLRLDVHGEQITIPVTKEQFEQAQGSETFRVKFGHGRISHKLFVEFT